MTPRAAAQLALLADVEQDLRASGLIDGLEAMPAESLRVDVELAAPEPPQEPPGPGGERTGDLVVADHPRPIADAKPFQVPGQGRRIGQRVSSRARRDGTGEVFLADMAQDVHILRLENDFITANGANVLAFEDGIDWEFWTIHAGEQDIVHAELTRQAIDDYIRREPEALPELAEGYERSITAWNLFWQNIFEACVPRPAAVPQSVS